MNYHYEIMLVNEKERWIFIKHDNWIESDAFINLLNTIKSDCNGKTIEVGDDQYKIEGSELELIYQWDSCFGSVVIYNKKEQLESVIDFLHCYFIKLNDSKTE